MLIETLTEKLLAHGALREIEFKNQKEIVPNSVFDWFSPSTFCCRELNVMLGYQINF